MARHIVSDSSFSLCAFVPFYGEGKDTEIHGLDNTEQMYHGIDKKYSLGPCMDHDARSNAPGVAVGQKNN
jgi:hypothetical protein